MHECVVCIGSNYDREENMFLARKSLTELFPSIRFTPERETEPLFFKNPALFLNQVATFTTEKEEESVRKALKEIESLSGRLPEDKKEEKVRLDIDLLRYNNRILKPEDWQREYIQRELSPIHNPLSLKKE